MAYEKAASTCSAVNKDGTAPFFHVNPQLDSGVQLQPKLGVKEAGWRSWSGCWEEDRHHLVESSWGCAQRLLHTLNLISCLRASSWVGLLLDLLLVCEADNTEGIGVGISSLLQQIAASVGHHASLHLTARLLEELDEKCAAAVVVVVIVLAHLQGCVAAARQRSINSAPPCAAAGPRCCHCARDTCSCDSKWV